MAGLLKGVLLARTEQKRQSKRAEVYRSLIRREAKLGGQLFGTAPSNVRREFFCLDENTWVWHEEWIDKSGSKQVETTRYRIHRGRVMKAKGGGSYRYVDKEEAINLKNAVLAYKEKIARELYSEYLQPAD